MPGQSSNWITVSGGNTTPTIPSRQTPRQPSNPDGSNPGTAIVPQTDGTYIETETLITIETARGWTTTYQTVVTRVCNECRVPLSAKKDCPKAISKVKAKDLSLA
ncbi:MAG: hypothetical protein LBJ12_09460 [Oscillospiraceae bacterium]|jgi:hypothetical protein|nr:hypothetical protein [Oscillospiraceae bacterium]